MSEQAEAPAGGGAVERTDSHFPSHPLRGFAVDEVHARPFRPIETPRVLHHLAFLAGEIQQDEFDALARFCAAHGAAAPAAGARHHIVTLGTAELRWERHTEFVTLTLSVSPPPGDPFQAPRESSLAAFLPKVPGELIVAARLALMPAADNGSSPDAFDASAVRASVDGGNAIVTTDFQPDQSGFTRILVEDHGLGAARGGALVQRLLEVETYRTLAFLGLPEAQRLTPILNGIEHELTTLTAAMRRDPGYESSRQILDRLIGLATGIEAESAAVAYRFGATHAYDEIVGLRLASIRETRVPGYGTIGSFLARRMKPAMRTCRTVEMRLADLSQKLSRATQLLRASVDIALESQNRDLLESMNRRARVQLRLQRMVEGLSVAAVSYYVVGLIGYLAAGGEDYFGWAIDPVHITAAAVPIVVLAVWLMVRSIRRRVEDD